MIKSFKLSHFLLSVVQLTVVLYFFSSCKFSDEKNKPADEDWPVYGGNKSGNRHSPLNQVNLKNVKQLKVAWIYQSEPASADKTIRSEMECQPIVVNGILYGVSPQLKVFALNASDGKKIWGFDPFKNSDPKITTSRGLVYWENGSDKRILFSAGSNLYAINAQTGEPVTAFGTQGKTDLHQGLCDQYNAENLYVAATSPGIVYKNTLIIGSAVSEGGDAAPGYVRAFDITTGKLKWVFHTIPQPGEPGYDTWPKDAYKKIGAVNNWSGLTTDEKRGMVFFGTGSPAADFYGGARAGMNLFSDCIMALDAESGKLKWYYQTIHHDLWDRDIPCPPNLATILFQGRKRDVVIQATKDGLIYMLDRDSGVSLFPVEERIVPTNGLPGEHPWPTQKFPLKPLPFSNQVFNEEDITNISSRSHNYIKKIFDSAVHSGKFIPPSEKTTLLYGYSGGAEWGGNAIDSNGILYQNTNNGLWKVEMESRMAGESRFASVGQGLYQMHCAGCHGPDKKGNGTEIPNLLGIGSRMKEAEINHVIQDGRRRMPSFSQLSKEERRAIIHYLANDESVKKIRKTNVKNESFPYEPAYRAKVWEKVYDEEGYPGIKPPWGTLGAIDMKTGDYLWQVPLGEHEELTRRGIQITGTENYGGPVVTEGGLIFIAATRDEKIRAFDKLTGTVVWEYKLPAAGFATPITYAMNGKQYIVIAAGGGRGLKSGSSYIAFALP
ncbi:MAG TPA: PQQ-binding-like beta-propeller repeat protein [Puia sp.]